MVQRIDADVWTPTGGCIVRVINSNFTYERRAVTQQLITMKNGGCSVQVIVNHIDQSEYDRMHAAGIEIKVLKIDDDDKGPRLVKLPAWMARSDGEPRNSIELTIRDP